MGTNVYYIKPITEFEKKEIHEVVNSTDSYEDLVEKIADVLHYDSDYQTGDSTHKVHIGKRSAGWKFLFSLGLRRYLNIEDNFKENLRRFLETGLIEDEYGDHYDFDTFWKEFVEDFQDGIDSKEYNIQYPQTSYPPTDIYYCGYRFTNEEIAFC